MFTTLLDQPERVVTWPLREAPMGDLAGLQFCGNRPVPRGRLIKYGPGVFLLAGTWRSVAVLDTYAHLPMPADVESQPKVLPFTAWHTDAACRGANTDLFFGDDSHETRPTLRRSVLGTARRICRGCPVRQECLDWALTNNEDYGIWAGTSGRQRKRMQDQIRAGEATQAEVMRSWLGT